MELLKPPKQSCGRSIPRGCEAGRRVGHGLPNRKGSWTAKKMHKNQRSFWWLQIFCITCAIKTRFGRDEDGLLTCHQCDQGWKELGLLVHVFWLQTSGCRVLWSHPNKLTCESRIENIPYGYLASRRRLDALKLHMFRWSRGFRCLQGSLFPPSSPSE